MKPEYIEMAKRLARRSVEMEPNITEIYLFPSDDEIRLIELDPTASGSPERVVAYYFPPEREENITLRTGLALIPPDEKNIVPPPEHWGDWNDAVLLYKKEDVAA